MKFSCVIPSLNPNYEWLTQALYSAKIFDEIFIHIQNSKDNILEYGEKTNKLLSLCSGDWLCIISDDDWFNVDGLKKTIELAKTTDKDIVCTPFYQVEKNKIYIEGNKIISDKIYEENYINPTSLFRKKVWEDIKFTGKYGQDWIFWAKAYKKGYTFDYLDVVTYYHRVRSDSECRRQYADFNNNFSKFREYILQEVNK